MVDLDQYQASVVSFFFEKLSIGGQVHTLEFPLTGDFSGKFRAAYSCIQGNDEAKIVFTLPSYSSSVFIAMTRTMLNDVARVLANLEDYERETGMPLGLGEVVIIPDPESMAGNLPYAVLLLRASVSAYCSLIPERALIKGRDTQFFLAVPLTRDEWELRRQRGHEALIDYFVEEGKETVF